MKIDLTHLSELRNQRLVSVVDDAASGLRLANYTAKAHYDQMWDSYPLLLDCRGLIFDSQGTVMMWPRPLGLETQELPALGGMPVL